MVSRNRLAESLREIGLAALGFILLVSLLAIWTSVTTTMFVVVYATMATAGVGYCVLYGYHESQRLMNDPDAAGSKNC